MLTVHNVQLPLMQPNVLLVQMVLNNYIMDLVLFVMLLVQMLVITDV